MSNSNVPYQGPNPTGLRDMVRGTEKAQVAAMSTAFVQIVIWILSEFDIHVPPSLNAAMATLVSAVLVWRVPNRAPAR